MLPIYWYNTDKTILLSFYCNKWLKTIFRLILLTFIFTTFLFFLKNNQHSEWYVPQHLEIEFLDYNNPSEINHSVWDYIYFNERLFEEWTIHCNNAIASVKENTEVTNHYFIIAKTIREPAVDLEIKWNNLPT